MSKKTKISQEDKDAFHEAMKGVKPLVHNKIPLASSKPTHQRVKEVAPKEKERFYFDDHPPDKLVGGEEFIVYKHASISNKMLRKLHKGQYNVEATLDLHGMTVEEAKTALNDFLQQCLEQAIRVVLIIHGKGHHSQAPILKNKLNHWLRSIDVVLAFCSAAPIHGNRGATYVLLRRMTQETTLG